jgi:tRNA pseudouridine32 synthase / 23S rRNA pseudouridine746 synthase
MVFIYNPPRVELDVIFCDDDLLVLNKPTGLLSVPGRPPEHKDCLRSRANERYPTALSVHRLDCDTSGLIIMGMTKAAHRNLSMQFEAKTTAKTYIAVVDGIVQEEEGSVDLPLIVDWPNRPRQKVDYETGKHALTHWRVLERLADRTRLELTPITGRSHQLRMHCLCIDHPILGDPLYAPPDALAKADRLYLHAESLSLDHPSTNERMTFKAPCPF